MGHAVYHRTASGEAQLEDVSSLEAALELVERLRNEDGPTEVRLLKEIPVEVRTYYRVVAAEEGDSSPSTPPEPVVEAAADGDTADDVVADDRDVAEDDDENVAASEDAASSASDDDAAAESDEDAVATSEDDDTESDEDSTVPSHDLPALKPISAEPPAGAMPLLSPPPTVTVHAADNAPQPAAVASGNEGRPKLFNRN